MNMEKAPERGLFYRINNSKIYKDYAVTHLIDGFMM